MPSLTCMTTVTMGKFIGTYLKTVLWCQTASKYMYINTYHEVEYPEERNTATQFTHHGNQLNKQKEEEECTQHQEYQIVHSDTGVGGRVTKSLS